MPKNLAELNEIIAAKESEESGVDTSSAAEPSEVQNDAIEVKADETTEAEAAAPAAETTGETGATEAAPEWTPNYKFTAYQKDYEVDDWAKPLITKDNQEQVLKLFSAAKATETMASEKEKWKSQFNEILPEFQNYKSSIDYLKQVAQEKDVGSVLKMLGWTNQDLAQHFLHLKQLEEMSPAQQAEYQRLQQAREENRTLKHQLSDFEIRQQNAVAVQHQTEVQNHLSNPTYKPLIEQYNSENGPGSFESLMQMIGQNHYVATKQIDPRTGMETGEYLPVSEVFNRAVKFARLNPTQAAAQSFAQSNSAPTAQKKAPPAPMPNIGKSAKAPGKPGFQSVKQLKEKYHQLVAQGE